MTAMMNSAQVIFVTNTNQHQNVEQMDFWNEHSVLKIRKYFGTAVYYCLLLFILL